MTELGSVPDLDSRGRDGEVSLVKDPREHTVENPSGVTRIPDSLHVALLAPDIAWNTGNAGRTCLAAGAHLHLIRPLGFSLDERRLKRAGLDYWQHVEPRVWPSWEAFATVLPELGEPFFFSAEGGCDLWSVAFPATTVLIFGGESGGLPPDVRQSYRERLVAIPMLASPVRSLNLSTSVGVAVYEVARQRGRFIPRSSEPPGGRRESP